MRNEQVGSAGASPSQDQDAKPIWQSRTIIGAAVTVFALVAGFKNFKVDVGNLTEILVQVAGLVGTALAIYGRIKATRPVKFLGSTQPGGAFNPSAPVKKAEAIPNSTFQIPKSPNGGNASVDALLLVAAIFAVVGIAFCTWPKAPETSLPLPDMCGGRPLSQWIQVVPVADSRPFFTRLLASLRATPGVALITTEQGTTSLKVISVELTGGAEF